MNCEKNRDFAATRRKVFARFMGDLSAGSLRFHVVAGGIALPLKMLRDGVILTALPLQKAL